MTHIITIPPGGDNYWPPYQATVSWLMASLNCQAIWPRPYLESPPRCDFALDAVDGLRWDNRSERTVQNINTTKRLTSRFVEGGTFLQGMTGWCLSQ